MMYMYDDDNQDEQCAITVCLLILNMNIYISTIEPHGHIFQPHYTAIFGKVKCEQIQINTCLYVTWRLSSYFLVFQHSI